MARNQSDGSALKTGEQPRHIGIVHRGRPRQDAPPKKKFADMTWTEKWWDRRNRWLKVMPIRLAVIDAGFQNLLKVADQDYYEFTDEEANVLVARAQAWVDALHESLQRGKPLQPGELPAIVLDHDLSPPAIPAPAGLEDIW